ncbi:toxin-antitoxin system protein [uncultured Porphyromonas sp.]|uniref:toxin-antitoxin system protein n=1 Tax=uncultured Porphyromonas sp. TaxID=159274 RepID=UPI00261BA4BA|nr:toxin-antitoxin system protein [uncultured Porphyromonas sp.]
MDKATLRTSTSICKDSDLLEQMKKEAKAENKSLSNYIETLLYRMGYRPYNEETIKACNEAKGGEFAGEVDTTDKSTIQAYLFDDE